MKKAHAIMNEQAFVKNITALFSKRNDVFTGIGDDAAALDLGLPGGKLLLAAADQVIENVHFLPETSPEDVARKLLNRNVSDIAAMGGEPTHALVTVSLNPVSPEWLDRFDVALEAEAQKYGLSIIGGDVSALPSPGIAATLTILGLVEREKLSLRENAKPGDVLFLTGSFGRSFPTEHHLHFTPRLAEGRFLAGDFTNAMMDVSDGLAKDLSRFAEASNLSVNITRPDALPRRNGASLSESLNDGEDYELIVAVPREKSEKLIQAWPFETPLTLAGEFISGEPGAVLVNNQPFQEKGYDHFHAN